MRARSRGVVYTGYTSLVTRPEVVGLIADEVERANADLARVEQVKAFRLLPRELDPEQDGEPVTPTRKVKRRLMAVRFGDLIDRCTATRRSGASLRLLRQALDGEGTELRVLIAGLPDFLVLR